MLWNLTVRSPRQLARDVFAGLRAPGTALRGAARFAAGLMMLAVAAELLVPVSIETRTFVILETWTLLTALLVESLVGGRGTARER